MQQHELASKGVQRYGFSALVVEGDDRKPIRRLMQHELQWALDAAIAVTKQHGMHAYHDQYDDAQDKHAHGDPTPLRPVAIGV